MSLEPFPNYPAGCLECSVEKNLFLCECGAALYCQPAHKELKHERHIDVCRIIVNLRQKYENLKSRLSEDELKSIYPENVMEWNFHTTESIQVAEVVQARLRLAVFLQAAYTRQGLEESIDLFRWTSILRPLRKTEGVEDPCFVASHLILSNRDDECRHFLREFTFSTYKWNGWSIDGGMASDPTRDPWDETDSTSSRCIPTIVCIFATLIKIRMLFELRELREIHEAVTERIGSRLPLELLDCIRFYLHRNPILATMSSARNTDYDERIEILQQQIFSLWWKVHQRCSFIWPFVIDERVSLLHNPSDWQPRHYCDHCNVIFASRDVIIDAWKHSPGAVDVISELLHRHDPYAVARYLHQFPYR